MANPNHTELSFSDYLRVFKRQAPIFCVVTGTILLIGVAIAYRTPPKYESTGMLLAEQPEQGAQPIVQSNVANNPQGRVSLVTQRVLTTENLERIIEENEPYPELGGSMGAALSQFRSNLELSAEDPEIIESVLGSSGRDGALAFSLSFTHSSPTLARDVADDLVSLYLEKNQEARQQRAEQTTEFLRSQAEELETEIGEREQRIADFKEEHAEALPERQDTNRELLDRTERDLEEVEGEVRTLREQRALYSRELAQLSPHESVVNEEGETVLGPQDRLQMLQREYMRLSARYSSRHPDLERVRQELEALSVSTGMPAFDRQMLRSELNAAEQELASARDRYSESHPDVQRLQSRVETLREQMRSAPSQPPSPRTAESPTNPAYIQKQVQLEATRTELQAALDRRDQLRARLDELENRLTTSPEVERQYSELQRGYEQLVNQYEEVEAKLRESQMALNLESSNQNKPFTILSSPGVPSSPSQPNRVAVLLLTMALAFTLGAGSVAVAESLNGRIRDAKDVVAYLDIPPLVAIPQINNSADVRRIYTRRFMTTLIVGAWAGIITFLVTNPAV